MRAGGGIGGNEEDDDDEVEGGEGEEGGGKADLTGMAAKIDLREIEAVLRVSRAHFLPSESASADEIAATPFVPSLQQDKRYKVFDHVPEQREQWVRVSPDSAFAEHLPLRR